MSWSECARLRSIKFRIDGRRSVCVTSGRRNASAEGLRVCARARRGCTPMARDKTILAMHRVYLPAAVATAGSLSAETVNTRSQSASRRMICLCVSFDRAELFFFKQNLNASREMCHMALNSGNREPRTIRNENEA